MSAARPAAKSADGVQAEDDLPDNEAFSDMSDDSDVCHVAAAPAEEPRAEEEADLLIAESTAWLAAQKDFRRLLYESLTEVPPHHGS